MSNHKVEILSDARPLPTVTEDQLWALMQIAIGTLSVQGMDVSMFGMTLESRKRLVETIADRNLESMPYALRERFSS